MVFQGICQESIGSMDYLVEEKFYSKKNEVYKVRYTRKEMIDNNIVVMKKYFQPHLNMKKEINLLLHLQKKGLTVPQIYYYEKDYIIIEYIEGKTLLDVIEEREKENSLKGMPYQSNAELIDKLIKWLKKFYNYTGGEIILKDINLRNFIVNTDGNIYGFDFEDCDTGKVEEDAGKFCAYILTYHPSFTPWKLQFTEEVFNLFIQDFNLNQDILLKEIEGEINNINERRGKEFSIKLFKNITKIP